MIAGVCASPDGRGDWDVLVVGAGPAGAVAAREVARAGARALLVDRAAFPRPKVCGACLNLRAIDSLDRLGLAERVAALGPRPLRRVRLAAGGAEAALALPGGCSLSRERFDEALAQAAVEAGAPILTVADLSVIDVIAAVPVPGVGFNSPLPPFTPDHVAAIAVFGNHPETIPEHYIRFLHNGFREKWGFLGSPLRVILRRKNS